MYLNRRAYRHLIRIDVNIPVFSDNLMSFEISSSALLSFSFGFSEVSRIISLSMIEGPLFISEKASSFNSIAPFKSSMLSEIASSSCSSCSSSSSITSTPAPKKHVI